MHVGLWPRQSDTQKIRKNYLVVLLQDVVHLSHILTGNGLDDVSLVIGSVKTSPTACLGVIGKGCAPGQGILPGWVKGEGRREEN